MCQIVSCTCVCETMLSNESKQFNVTVDVKTLCNIVEIDYMCVKTVMCVLCNDVQKCVNKQSVNAKVCEMWSSHCQEMCDWMSPPE